LDAQSGTAMDSALGVMTIFGHFVWAFMTHDKRRSPLFQLTLTAMMMAATASASSLYLQVCWDR
jgi:hypothetical protein